MRRTMQSEIPEELGLMLEAYHNGRRQDSYGNNHLVIPCRDIDCALARGYRFVAALPDGRLIVERDT